MIQNIPAVENESGLFHQRKDFFIIVCCELFPVGDQSNGMRPPDRFIRIFEVFDSAFRIRKIQLGVLNRFRIVNLP